VEQGPRSHYSSGPVLILHSRAPIRIGEGSADGGRDRGWCQRRSRDGEDESIKYHSEAIIHPCDHSVRILRRRDRHHHALTSHRRGPKRGWWSGTRGGGLPRTTDVGDRRGWALTGWWAIRNRSQCSRRGQGRTWRSSRWRSGRNLRGTARAGRGATSDLNPGGTSGAGWQGAMVPAVVSRVPTVETVEPDSQRKSRSVGLGEAVRGGCPHQKPHVERQSGSLWRDQGSGSICDQRSSQGRHTG
jgi:hypothetical protein